MTTGEFDEERQQQLRLLGRGRRCGLSSLISHSQKTSKSQNLSLTQLGEQVHPLKDRLAHLGKPQQKLADYIPWMHNARESDMQQKACKNIQYHSLRLSQLGFEKGRRSFQLEQIGLRFWDILAPSFPIPQSERQSSLLLALPDELLLYILWLAVSTERRKEIQIILLEKVCRRFRRLCNSSEIWRLMCSCVWGFPHTNIKQFVPYKNWKRLYCEWTTQICIPELEVGDEFLAGDGNCLVSEVEWRSACYRLIQYRTLCPLPPMFVSYEKIIHDNISRIFYFSINDLNCKILTEHVGYCYLWSDEFMTTVKDKQWSETNIRSVIYQIVSALDYLSNALWSNLSAEGIMLFSCWPCSIFFSPDLRDVKLGFWWNDIISDEVRNPEPRKYLFVAPEVILEDRPKGSNRSHIWCLGVVLYTMLSLRFPFGGVDFPAVRVLMSILDDEVDYTGLEWDTISNEAKDLLQKILVKDPSRRITLQEIMQHPWMTQSIPNTPLLVYKSVQKSPVYRCFNPRNRLKLYHK